MLVMLGQAPPQKIVRACPLIILPRLAARLAHYGVNHLEATTFVQIFLVHNKRSN